MKHRDGVSDNPRTGAGTWRALAGPLATPAGVRTHLEAALQDGQTGGSFLAGLSYLSRTRPTVPHLSTFAACSNVSTSLCVHPWVCSEKTQPWIGPICIT